MPNPIANRVQDLIAPRLRPIRKPLGHGFDATLHEVSTALAKHQAAVRSEMLAFLRQMPPQSFEDLIRVLLEALGYEDAEIRGKSGDGGVDVTATLRLHGMASVPTVVQAERWARAVPGDIVRQLRGALHVDEHGIAITTSTFTKDAVAEAGASGKAPIALVDGPEFVDLLIEQGIGVQKRPVSV